MICTVTDRGWGEECGKPDEREINSSGSPESEYNLESNCYLKWVLKDEEESIRYIKMYRKKMSGRENSVAKSLEAGECYSNCVCVCVCVCVYACV